jgi:FAD:protein FMN transferase
MKILYYLVHGISISVGLISITQCRRDQERQLRSSLFSVPVEVRFVAPERKIKTAAAEDVLKKVLQSVESTFSQTNPESELSLLNRSEKLTWLPVSRALVTVIEEALRVSDLTHGAWDFTAGKLNALYQDGKNPGPLTLESAKTKTGYFHVEARKDPLAVKRSRRGLTLELKALAIGFAADEIAEALRKAGVVSFRVAIGRVVKASTSKASESWTYSIERPRSDAAVTESVPIDNRAMATVSTLGEELAILDYPLIDPRSGKPLVSDLISVTAAETSALKAVATAIALLVVGTSEGKLLAEKVGANAYFISQAEGNAIALSTPLFPRNSR